MTDRDAMLQSICTDPRCDTPRLAFADWLEERGECDRAEFIKVQVELARLECKSCKGKGTYSLHAAGGYGLRDIHCSDCNAHELRRRERELLKLCWRPYFRHLFPEPHGILFPEPHGIEVGALTMLWAGRIEAEPARGFIRSVSLPWGGDNGWLRHSPALFWHEKQTVECPCLSLTYDDIAHRAVSLAATSRLKRARCKVCNDGRIPKSFPPTAQPLEEVRLTTWPNQLAELVPTTPRFTARGTDNSTIQFDRATCRTCNGDSSWMADCPDCDGRPLNEWRCDDWPGLVFRMPE